MRFFFLFLVPVLCYVPFCINCKHYKVDLLDKKYGTCKLFPINQKDDYYLVTGIDKTKKEYYHYCSTARSTARMCGEEGKGFKEID
jgi:hypothetical protein